MRTACDTSVLVPALIAGHELHEQCLRLIEQEVSLVPAHALMECYSVLTRLPPPFRIAPQTAAAMVQSLGLEIVGLSPHEHTRLVRLCADQSVRGGSVYDAVIGWTAHLAEAELVSADTRAHSTYASLGVSVRTITSS